MKRTYLDSEEKYLANVVYYGSEAEVGEDAGYIFEDEDLTIQANPNEVWDLFSKGRLSIMYIKTGSIPVTLTPCCGYFDGGVLSISCMNYDSNVLFSAFEEDE